MWSGDREREEEVGELDVGESDADPVGASAAVAEVGMPQRAGQDHQLLGLARARVSGGEQVLVMHRTRGASEDAAGAANPNRARLWKTKPSAYVARRPLGGLNTKDIFRCLKRFVAREVYHHLTSAFSSAPSTSTAA